ncbi:MAG: hypothetical protein H6742_04170 [Alphaproteobacteria bacterium]|nr:hypothetical protein [Alphaproteobacteria bacterium]
MTFRKLGLFAALCTLPLVACGDKDGDSGGSAATGGCDDPDYNPMAGTCVYDFMADCFDPSGECTGEIDATTGATDFTWENGASVTSDIDYTDPTSPVVITTLTASSGSVCAVGETVTSPSGECFSTTTYTRNGDGAQQVWCIKADGSYTITCPGGETVDVSASAAAAVSECQYSGGDGDAGECETDISGGYY